MERTSSNPRQPQDKVLPKESTRISFHIFRADGACRTATYPNALESQYGIITNLSQKELLRASKPDMQSWHNLGGDGKGTASSKSGSYGIAATEGLPFKLLALSGLPLAVLPSIVGPNICVRQLSTKATLVQYQPEKIRWPLLPCPSESNTQVQDRPHSEKTPPSHNYKQ